MLKLEAITKTFAGFTALEDADFELRPGEVHALLGENGAGKSTLMNVAAGIYVPDSGTVRVEGRPVVINGASDAKALGIGMVHQHFKLVRPFTGLQNLLLAMPGGRYGAAMEAMRARAQALAAEIGFAVDLERRIDTISVADRQRIEILRVLLAGARTVILDEPTAVLTDEEAERLFEAVRRLASDGRSVVLVTHKLSEVFRHTDRVTVMRAGRVQGTVLPAEVNADELTRMIVGTRITRRRQAARSVGPPRMTVEKLCCTPAEGRRALDAVSFVLRGGEIYGLAGVGGNGQEELVEAMMGLRPVESGRVVLAEEGDITGADPVRLRRIGFGWIPSDRQRHALAGTLPIVDNYAINGVLKGRFGSGAGLSNAAMRREMTEAITRFEVAGVRGPMQKAALLSGGNAQKLVIAREFSADPKVVIAHSPSRGLDLRAAAAVHDHLRAARDRGAAVMVISEDLDEILMLADRIGVISRGRIVAEFDDADRQAIGNAMVGHA
jgi:simple sugar transport system ATP-binding protein